MTPTLAPFWTCPRAPCADNGAHNKEGRPPTASPPAVIPASPEAPFASKQPAVRNNRASCALDAWRLTSFCPSRRRVDGLLKDFCEHPHRYTLRCRISSCSPLSPETRRCNYASASRRGARREHLFTPTLRSSAIPPHRRVRTRPEARQGR